jgi:hypothetical protein
VQLIRVDPRYKQMSPKEVIGKFVSFELMIKESKHIVNMEQGATFTPKVQPVAFKATEEDKRESTPSRLPIDAYKLDNEEMTLIIKSFRQILKQRRGKDYKPRSKRVCHKCFMAKDGKKKKVQSRTTPKYTTSSDEDSSSEDEDDLLTLFANLNMEQKEKLNELIGAIHEKDELLDSQEKFLIKENKKHVKVKNAYVQEVEKCENLTKELSICHDSISILRTENTSLISKVRELNICNDSISCLRNENSILHAKIDELNVCKPSTSAVKKINDNAYKLELPPEFRVSPTFNIAYLKLYLGEEDELESRTTPLQEGEDDEDITSIHTINGPITRSRARQLILQVRSALVNCVSELTLGAMDVLMIRNLGEDQQELGKGLGVEEEQQGRPQQEGDQVRFGCDSILGSRTSLH